MGKMRQFRRALRSCVGKVLAYQIGDGYGAVLAQTLEQVIRGGKIHDQDIYEMFDDGRVSLADIVAGEPAAMEDDEGGDRAKKVTIAAGPMIIPGGANGKATALISVRGVAMYDIEYQPYAFSTLLLSQTMTALGNDPQIGTIVLDVDSPGGMVTGTKEAADAIYAARKKKKVIALINPLAASAAYYLASQASEIIAVPSADIGSIGVFMVHADCSKFNEKQGVNYTYIYAGKYKIEGNSDMPLSDEAKNYYQSEVDFFYSDFLKAVARGRNTTIDVVREQFGEGRTMIAPMAKKAGMIDEIATIDAALARCGITVMPASGARRRSEASAEGDSPSIEGLTVTEASAGQATPELTLFSGEKITFQERTAEDGTKSYYVLDAVWPKRAAFITEAIAPTLVRISKEIASGSALVEIQAANGNAIYREVGTAFDDTLVCDLVTGSEISAVPVAENDNPAPTNEAASDAAAEQKRAADARRRRLQLLRA